VTVMTTSAGRRTWAASPSRWLLWAGILFFLVNVAAIVASVVVDSFAGQWFGNWLPQTYTGQFYAQAWRDFALGHVLLITVVVSGSVTLLALIIGAPAAYLLARREFLGKRLLWLLFLVPMLVPPVTYGIPLATLLYRLGLGGNLSGVVLGNLVPAVPLVVLVLTPYFEQIDSNLEAAGRACGARGWQVFQRILVPLMLPGLLSAGLLVLVQSIGMFELTFFIAGPTNQTLVVSLYYALWAPGIRPPQEIDAMAVMYMLLCMALLFVALRFVSPTQMVTQIKDNRE
jgi:putative spermidine/putrescine transport system permease protein